MAGGGIGRTVGRVALAATGYGIGAMAGYPALGSALALGLGSWLFPPKQEKKVRQVRSAFGTSSVEGTPVTVVFGTVRIGATLIWADSSYIYHQTTKKQKGKGGGSSTVVTDAWYTLSFAMALGEGPMQLIKIYEGKNVVGPSYTWYDGDDGQIPDSFLTSKTGKAIAYKHTAYIVFQDYNVGPTAQLPQLTFEVVSGQSKFDVSLTVTDTDGVTRNLTKKVYVNVNALNTCTTPAYAINTMITNTRFGGGFQKNVDWLQAHSDCIDKTYFLNLAFTERRDLASIIEVIASHGWIVTTFSGSDIKLLLAKNTVPTKTLELDDMLGSRGEQVIDVAESGRSDRFNRLSIEFTDPAKEYSVRPILVEDLADQQGRGVKKNTVSLLGFTNPDIVKDVGYKMMRNSLYGRRLFNFSLGPKQLDLEVGDLRYLNASTVGLSLTRSRIIGIDETEEFNLVVSAREEPFYIYDTVNYTIPSSNASPATNVSAGLSNAIGFRVEEVPKELQTSSGVVELMPLYARQHVNTIGYDIYSSVDDITYSLVHEGRKPLPYGVVTGLTVNKDSWLDTNEFSIDTGSTYNSTFSSVSRLNMMSGENLTLVDDELMLHQTSTLGTTNVYTLDNFARNRFNTLPSVHSPGAGLMQINDAERFELLKNKIGVKYYFKAVPINTFNQAGDISEISSVGLTVQGWAYRPYRPGSIWMEENGVSQRGRSRTANKDISIGWDIVDKLTGYGRNTYNSGTYGMYSQDSDYVSSEVDVLVGGTLKRTANVGTTQSYTYTEAFNIADNTTFNNNITFRVYTKSIYGRSRYYQEKTITSV